MTQRTGGNQQKRKVLSRRKCIWSSPKQSFGLDWDALAWPRKSDSLQTSPEYSWTQAVLWTDMMQSGLFVQVFSKRKIWTSQAWNTRVHIVVQPALWMCTQCFQWKHVHVIVCVLFKQPVFWSYNSQYIQVFMYLFLQYFSIVVYTINKQCNVIKLEYTSCFVLTCCFLYLYNDKHGSERPGKQMSFLQSFPLVTE